MRTEVGLERVCRVAILAITIGLVIGGMAAGDTRFQNGLSSVSTDKPTKAKQLDIMASNVTLLPDIDQSKEIRYGCSLRVGKRDGNDFEEVGNVKARWETIAYLVDRATSSSQTFNVGSGTLKTDLYGQDFVNIDIPPEVASRIFRDGFESGDILAGIATRLQFRKGKKINSAILQCSLDEFPR